MTDFSYEAWPSGEPYDWGGAARGANPYDQIDFHVDLGCGTVKKGRIGIDHHPAPGVNIVMDLDARRTYAMACEPGQDAVVYDEHNGDWLWRTGPEGGYWRYPVEAQIRPSVDRAEARAFPKRELLGGEVLGLLDHGLPFESDSIETIISHHAMEHIGEGFLPLMDEVYRVLVPGGLFRAITPLFPSRTAVEDPDHRRWFMQGTWDALCGDPENCWQSSFSVPYTRARFKMLDKDTSPMLPPQEWWGEHDAREMRVALEAKK